MIMGLWYNFYSTQSLSFSNQQGTVEELRKGAFKKNTVQWKGNEQN